MEKFSETDISIRNQRIDHINRRWGQLYELEKDWGERALRYLIMTNSGGAIATLSFLGASEKALAMPAVITALFFFVTGVFLVGVSTARTFHHMSGLFKTYKVDANNYFTDKILWHHLCDGDDKRAVTYWLDTAIPYSSFACFIFGCIAGGYALFGCT